MTINDLRVPCEIAGTEYVLLVSGNYFPEAGNLIHHIPECSEQGEGEEVIISEVIIKTDEKHNVLSTDVMLGIPAVYNLIASQFRAKHERFERKVNGDNLSEVAA